MTDTGTSPAPPPQVWPTLRARDARGLIRYLVEVFGFEETAVYGDGDMVHHAQLSWPPGGGIMLGSARDEGSDGWGLQPGTFGAYVVMDDVEVLHERVQRAGGRIRRPRPRRQQMVVRDISRRAAPALSTGRNPFAADGNGWPSSLLVHSRLDSAVRSILC